MFIYDDDFLTESEIEQVTLFFHSEEIDWRYFKTTQDNQVDHPGVVNTGAKDISYFSAGFHETSQHYQNFKWLVDKFCSKHGIEYVSLGRVKLNVTPIKDSGLPLYPHVDKNEPHLIFLYYVHDSDGDTVLYNETYTGEIVKPPVTVMHSITPKRGAAFIVSGNHFHAITPPTNHSVRSVINANLNIEAY